MTPADQTGKLVILSAPSGAGKSTIVNYLLGIFDELEFAISATSRAPRGDEQNGIEYFFFSCNDFKHMVAEDKFVEWEEVYQGTCYGTLRSEICRIWGKGNVIIFDVDVKGGISLKKIFGDQALSIFIMPPSVEALRERLVKRGTDSAEAIEKRVGKATQEIALSPQFDKVVVNDDLATAQKETEALIAQFIR